MPLDPDVLDAVTTALKFVGLTSFSSFIALQVAWISFPPEITIEGVIDKSKKLNSESKLKIKNLGKLPANDIRTNITKLNFVLGRIRMRDSAIINAPKPISRLANSETTEISVAPGVMIQDGGFFSEFDYSIELTYEAKLFFLKKTFRKIWLVELRNIGEEFAWHVSLA
ncbi:hypothetical protein [Rhodoferax sp. U11-2br]|uniref:hypothetical protein n=1 Tax=Rhodoferax sp. U11-2br TaxID=2838878 RepID=UPI001BE764A1|nr:hypothetical protein [Rhodoferax sp. U11-2br]MBT3065669.1 hypothetical protein [Rhodoferax sp. U11-2br]